MHGFLKVVGIVIAAIGVLAGAAFFLQSGSNGLPLYGLLIGASLALPGAMLYCFGAIVEHLIDIRWTARQQLAALEKLAGGSVTPAVDTSRWSARDRAAYEQKLMADR